MALSNLSGWNEKTDAPATACGTACGAGDKPDEKPAACGTACGAGDKPDGAQGPVDLGSARTEAERRQAGGLWVRLWSWRQVTGKRACACPSPGNYYCRFVQGVIVSTAICN